MVELAKHGGANREGGFGGGGGAAVHWRWWLVVAAILAVVVVAPEPTHTAILLATVDMAVLRWLLQDHGANASGSAGYNSGRVR